SETWTMEALDGTPVRVIAATLWTDFGCFGPELRARAMTRCHALMNDFRQIGIADRPHEQARRLEPMDVLRIHGESRSFIEHELSAPFGGLTIVMTHHAPSARSLSARYHGDLLGAAYASDLEDLIGRFQPALWVHGHVHESADYTIGRTRVVCNPRGYTPFELNPRFDPELAIEIG
ncbi:MAG: hypothetical protein ACREEP_05010, partial [Dongiaceae bacterium]